MSDHSEFETGDPPVARPTGERPRAHPHHRVRIRTHGGYGATRLVIALITLLGWLSILVGVIAVLLAISEMLGFSSVGSDLLRDADLSVIRLALGAYGLAMILVGFLTIAFAQNVRANIDSADYARQALVLQKAIAEGMDDIDTNRMSDRPASRV